MCSNWYPSLIYKSYSILCYMFCFSWVCTLPKKRMSNSYMFKNIWKKRVKIWVYLLWLNAFISKVTQLSIIVAFYFGLILVSIPLTSSLFFLFPFFGPKFPIVPPCFPCPLHLGSLSYRCPTWVTNAMCYTLSASLLTLCGKKYQ